MSFASRRCCQRSTSLQRLTPTLLRCSRRDTRRSTAPRRDITRAQVQQRQRSGTSRQLPHDAHFLIDSVAQHSPTRGTSTPLYLWAKGSSLTGKSADWVAYFVTTIRAHRKRLHSGASCRRWQITRNESLFGRSSHLLLSTRSFLAIFTEQILSK